VDERNPKPGDYIRSSELTEHKVKLVGTFYGMEPGGTGWLIDYQMSDSNAERLVLVAMKPEDCEILTEEEMFLWNLKGRGVGIRDVMHPSRKES